MGGDPQEAAFRHWVSETYKALLHVMVESGWERVVYEEIKEALRHGEAGPSDALASDYGTILAAHLQMGAPDWRSYLFSLVDESFSELSGRMTTHEQVDNLRFSFDDLASPEHKVRQRILTNVPQLAEDLIRMYREDTGIDLSGRKTKVIALVRDKAMELLLCFDDERLLEQFQEHGGDLIDKFLESLHEEVLRAAETLWPDG